MVAGSITGIMVSGMIFLQGNRKVPAWPQAARESLNSSESDWQELTRADHANPALKHVSHLSNHEMRVSHIIDFNWVLHQKPSICINLFYPHLWNMETLKSIRVDGDGELGNSFLLTFLRPVFGVNGQLFWPVSAKPNNSE